MVQYWYQKRNPYSRPIENKLQDKNNSLTVMHQYKSHRNNLISMIKYAREQFFLSANKFSRLIPKKWFEILLVTDSKDNDRNVGNLFYSTFVW
jgi:hypothetical protein